MEAEDKKQQPINAVQPGTMQNQMENQVPPSANLTHKPSSNNYDGVEYFQVVPDRQLMTNQELLAARIKQIQQKFKQEEEINRRKAQQQMAARRKMKPDPPKPKPKQKQQTPAQRKKRERLKKIEPHIQNFHVSRNTECGYMRCKLKEETFKWLFYGIEQLQDIKKQQQDSLKYEQKKILNMGNKEQYAYVHGLVNQIDAEFLKKWNSGGKDMVQLPYNSFMRSFIQELAEDSNYMLRRRILNKQLTTKRMSTMQQEDFYCPQLKARKQEERQILLRQISAPEKPVYKTQPDYINLYVYEAPPQEKPAKQQKVEAKPTYKYISETSLSFIKGFLRVDHVDKMKKSLTFQGRPHIQERLRGSICKVFQAEL